MGTPSNVAATESELVERLLAKRQLPPPEERRRIREAAGASLRDVTLNQFHVDFTREFIVPEVKGLRSFLTGSVGATHVAAARDSFTRFSFGFGAGLKQFLGSRLALRAEAKWLPILIDPEVGAWACGTVAAGGCLVVLTGPLTQQFELSFGPVVRF